MKLSRPRRVALAVPLLFAASLAAAPPATFDPFDLSRNAPPSAATARAEDEDDDDDKDKDDKGKPKPPKPVRPPKPPKPRSPMRPGR